MTISRALLRALATKHVDTVTIADTWAQGDTVTLTVNTKAFVVTIGTLVTTTQVATTLKQAFNGETLTDTSASCFPSIADSGGQGIPEFTDLVATSSGAVVSLTGATAGVPHTITASEVTAGTGTATLANATVASGPSFYNNVNNWTEGSVPAAADDAYVDNVVDTPILYGLSNAGATLTSFNVGASFGSTIGLPKINPAGYTEYRADYLAIDASAISIGRGDGPGSSRIKIDSGTIQTSVDVIQTGGQAEAGLPAVIWKGTHAANVVEVKGGTFGAGVYGGEVATIVTLNQSGGVVFCGAGVTLTTISKSGGDLIINSAATTITNSGGSVTTFGAGAITTLNVTGGSVRSNSSGTITALNVGGRGEAQVDFRGDQSARTVTTLTLSPGGEVTFVPGTLTFTTIAIDGKVSRLRAD